MPQQPIAMSSSQVISSSVAPVKREEMSDLSHLDQRALQVLSRAKDEAIKVKQALIEPEHVLLGLLYDNEIFKLFEQFSLQAGKISREIQGKETIGVFTGQPTLSEDSKKVFEDAYTETKERNAEFVTPEDILIAIMSANIKATDMLVAQGLTKEQLGKALEKEGKFNTGKRSYLTEFGTDMTEQAAEGVFDPVTQRADEIERVIHILLRRTKNNPVVIGDAGVGKTAIVEGLAQLIVQKQVPPDLMNKRIIQIDMASLIAGASHRGEFEERFRNIIKEAQQSDGQIILFIDEIHVLIGTGAEGALDASNIIKPFLARGQIQIIGTTTTSEYRRYLEKDKSFERRFQTVQILEPSIDSAVKMIEVLKPKYEKYHNVVISPEAIDTAVKFSKRYIGERFLPDKAVDVLDETASEVKLLFASGKRDNNTITPQDIEKVISRWTGIPLTKLTEDESEKLLHLEDMIHKRLINQEIAVASIAEAVRRGRIGLANTNRPIASFIFLGPTGVGKTELAKTLAEILFGKEDLMVRLDMSEYMEKHEVAKLIGAPPGYVGYEEGGQLTEAVRLKPYSVLLLDEIEKAHPDVFNILLQLLEDGRLTDNKGNTISFKNTIIIATSNIGSVLIQQQLQEEIANVSEDKEQKMKKLKNSVTEELHKFFKPELLNRFDEVIIFEPLGQNHMLEIANLQIAETKKLLMEQKIDLTCSPKALEQLAKDGYDPLYGARPLRRIIQTAIENPIARLIIEKKFIPGDTILIDYDQAGEKYVFPIAIKRETVNIGQTVQVQEDTSSMQGETLQKQPLQIEQQTPNTAVTTG
jgi:ATP-dependent Clp protease ATP-binding subunit ClpC